MWNPKDKEAASVIALPYQLSRNSDKIDTKEDQLFLPTIVSNDVTKNSLDYLNLSANCNHAIGVTIPNPISSIIYNQETLIKYKNQIRNYFSEINKENESNSLTLAMLLTDNAGISHDVITDKNSKSNNDGNIVFKKDGLNIEVKNEETLNKNNDFLKSSIKSSIIDLLKLTNSLFKQTSDKAGLSSLISSDLISNYDNINLLKKFIYLEHIKNNKSRLFDFIFNLKQYGKTDQDLSDNSIISLASKIDAFLAEERLGLSPNAAKHQNISFDDIKSYLSPYIDWESKEIDQSKIAKRPELLILDDFSLEALMKTIAWSYSCLRDESSMAIVNLSKEDIINVSQIQGYLVSNWSEIAYHILRLSDSSVRSELIRDQFWQTCGLALPSFYEPIILGRMNDYVVIDISDGVIPNLENFSFKENSQ